jgi:hypothetical protein
VSGQGAFDRLTAKRTAEKMGGRAKVEPGLFRVEVWFDDACETIQIRRMDPRGEGQRLSCTFEEWEQIKHAVDHLFDPPATSFHGYEEMWRVAGGHRN